MSIGTESGVYAMDWTMLLRAVKRCHAREIDRKTYRDAFRDRKPKKSPTNSPAMPPAIPPTTIPAGAPSANTPSVNPINAPTRIPPRWCRPKNGIFIRVCSLNDGWNRSDRIPGRRRLPLARPRSPHHPPAAAPSAVCLKTVVATPIIAATSLRFAGTISVLPSFARLPNRSR